jgi:hypothetical protein
MPDGRDGGVLLATDESGARQAAGQDGRGCLWTGGGSQARRAGDPTHDLARWKLLEGVCQRLGLERCWVMVAPPSGLSFDFRTRRRGPCAPQAWHHEKPKLPHGLARHHQPVSGSDRATRCPCGRGSNWRATRQGARDALQEGSGSEASEAQELVLPRSPNCRTGNDRQRSPGGTKCHPAEVSQLPDRGPTGGFASGA